jgi:large subunit ribosomal protein L14
MIQKGSYINIIDNSGAKEVSCIHVFGGYRKRYGYLGDIVLCSVKSLRKKRRTVSKIKKGDIVRVLLVRTKKPTLSLHSHCISYFENGGIILNNQNKFVSTRIFGSLPKSFRYTKFLRAVSLSSGSNE